jgi:hypothetical protein
MPHKLGDLSAKLNPLVRILWVKGLNFLKKNDSDHKKQIWSLQVATIWEWKNNHSGFETRYKGDLLLIFCCYYTDRVTPTQIIRTEGFSFADNSPGTDPTYTA